LLSAWFPILIGSGPELVMIYNDALPQIIGALGGHYFMPRLVCQFQGLCDPHLEVAGWPAVLQTHGPPVDEVQRSRR
jgi:hypothetical protein